MTGYNLYSLYARTSEEVERITVDDWYALTFQEVNVWNSLAEKLELKQDDVP